jgi:Septum formation
VCLDVDMTDDPEQEGSPAGPGQWPGWAAPGDPGDPGAATRPSGAPGSQPPPGTWQPPGYGYPYGGGWPPPGPPQTEGLALAALLLALASFVVPLLPAIAALVVAGIAAGRIRASGGALGGRGMVTAARVLAVLELLLVAGAVAAIVAVAGRHTTVTRSGSPASPATAGRASSATGATTGATEPPGELVGFDHLQAGDCFQAPRNDQDVGEVRVVRCTTPHDVEVFAIVAAPGGATYPGDKALGRVADTRCGARFGAYVGTAVDDSSLDYSSFLPTRQGWEQGQDRTIVCVLEDPDGAKLTGSMRGSGR